MSNADPSERESWFRTLYQIAHSDVRWTKEQGWRVVNWALLLFAAIIAVAKYLLQSTPWYSFAIVGTLVFIASIFFLVDLHGAGAIARGNADRIEAQIPSGDDVLERRSGDPDHSFYLKIQIIIVAVGLVLTVLVLASLTRSAAAV